MIDLYIYIIEPSIHVIFMINVAPVLIISNDNFSIHFLRLEFRFVLFIPIGILRKEVGGGDLGSSFLIIKTSYDLHVRLWRCNFGCEAILISMNNFFAYFLWICRGLNLALQLKIMQLGPLMLCGRNKFKCAQFVISVGIWLFQDKCLKL